MEGDVKADRSDRRSSLARLWYSAAFKEWFPIVVGGAVALVVAPNRRYQVALLDEREVLQVNADEVEVVRCSTLAPSR